jgi:hypothetical protein
MLGDYRWLLVRAPGNKDFGINIEARKDPEEIALVEREAGDQPLFSMQTNNEPIRITI